MDGLLLVDKPSGWTSFDVVAKVRSILKQSGVQKPKVGHTGTLDPLATGLLVLLVGDYTKRAQEFSKLDKTYEVTMKVGETSSTGDGEGEKTKASSYKPSEKELEAVIKSFEGEIMQIPPQYSAIKINGQRAYKLARKGQKVELEPRKVKIYHLKLHDYTYPEVKFMAEVSSGTYIRSLVEDIGTKCKTGAYITALRRTKVGKFWIEDGIDINNLQKEYLNKVLQI